MTNSPSTPRMIDELRERQRRPDLARDIVGAAYLRGDFVLSSGDRSDYYLDKYLFETKPSILRRVASFLAEMVPARVDRLAGSELGAVPLVTAVALETGLPFAIIRTDPHSRLRRVEGELYGGEHVVLVEDVVSTGRQAARAARRLRTVGAVVDTVLAAIDRQQGASELLEAEGLHFDALFTRADLDI